MQVRKQQLELDMEQQDWFQIGVRQGSILSLCLFNLYAEYIMRNAGLEEALTAWADMDIQHKLKRRLSVYRQTLFSQPSSSSLLHHLLTLAQTPLS